MIFINDVFCWQVAPPTANRLAAWRSAGLPASTQRTPAFTAAAVKPGELANKLSCKTTYGLVIACNAS